MNAPKLQSCRIEQLAYDPGRGVLGGICSRAGNSSQPSSSRRSS
ncbi:hypothetical protein GGI1_19064, partial [Acidithiobacillus sp. GGI-221]